MRSYRIERSTMEWNHILRQIENGNKPIYKKEEEAGETVLDRLVADVEQALEHDDNHFHNKGTPLPERMSNSSDPVVPWRTQRENMNIADALRNMADEFERGDITFEEFTSTVVRDGIIVGPTNDAFRITANIRRGD